MARRMTPHRGLPAQVAVKPLPYKTVEQALNGSMVQDIQDAVKHGKLMRGIKTNRELRDDGLIPDPIQD